MPHSAKTFEIFRLALVLKRCPENTFISVWEIGYPKYKARSSLLCFSDYDMLVGGARLRDPVMLVNYVF